MKSIRHISIIMLSIALFPAMCAAQMDSRRTVGVSDFSLLQERSGTVTISFTLAAGAKAAATGATLTVTPTLTNGAHSRELTPVVIQGRRAAILSRRNAIASGQTAETDAADAICLANGDTAAYRTAIGFEEWMPGSRLTLKGSDEHCAFVAQSDLGTVAENLMVPVSDFTTTERVVIPGPILSTADKLNRHFPFVQPAPADSTGMDADADDVSRSLRTSRREGSLTIFFRRGSDEVVPDYRDNYRSLVDLLSVIEEIHRSDDSRIERIAVTGFASPEGTHALNMRLSERRAEAMRRVIAQNSPALANRIAVYAGGEDWEGLRELAAASTDTPHRDEVLRIIEAAPCAADKKGALMRLDGGRVYRWMDRHLFPELREATFIIIYYKNDI